MHAQSPAALASAPSSAPAADAVLYPPIEPFDQFMLDVGGGHLLHVEQCGHPDGLPVIVLHGGPASGTSPLQRRFFDPASHRIVLFDQRGAGRSRPNGALHDNTTAHLLRDIESIRERLRIDRWLVFGGSWGASLGLAYAAVHRARCTGLLLRGSFLTGDADLDWFFGGAGMLLPVAWTRIAGALGFDPQHIGQPGAGIALMDLFARQLFADDAAVAGAAANAWNAWEEALTQGWRGVAPSDPGLPPAPSPAPPPAPDAAAITAPPALPSLLHKYRIQSHYLQHRCWLGEAELLRLARTLDGVPTTILHGRLDWICRPANALALHRAIGGSTLRWIDAAGHSPFDAPMAAAIVQTVRDLTAAAPR